MTTNLQNNTATTHESTRETTVPTTASHELAVTIELLAAVGLAAEAVFDGDAELCPYCLSQVFSEAA